MSPARVDPGRNQERILYFSRGLGRSHAVIDIKISKALDELGTNFEFLFVSHATGADTFKQQGHPVVDLGIPERPSFLEALLPIARIIEECKPVAVISHEGFEALPAAKIFKLPAILITHWFVDAEHSSTETLDYVDRVVFLEEPGLFPEPPNVKGKVDYVGPPVRNFSYQRTDRSRARKELGLSEKGLVVLVLQGSFPEAQAPIVDVVIPAFDALKSAGKQLIWVADQDYAALHSRLGHRRDLTIKETDWQIDRLMVASDLVITKATYNIDLELMALGVPSISILKEKANPFGRVFSGRNPTATILDYERLTWRRLARCMKRTLATVPPRSTTPGHLAEAEGIRGAAAAITSYLADQIDRSSAKSHRQGK